MLYTYNTDFTYNLGYAIFNNNLLKNIMHFKLNAAWSMVYGPWSKYELTGEYL